MIASAFRGTDGSAAGNALVIQSSSAISSLSTMTVWVWVSSPNVSNSLRNIAGKSVSGPGGWEWFRRGVDGTQLQMSRYRSAGTPLTMQTPAGTLKANVPQFIFLTLDLSTSANCKMWVGTLDAPAASITPTVSLGSGAGASDAAQALQIGNTVSGSAGWPGTIWAMGISGKIDYTLDEIRRIQYSPLTFRNAAGLWIFDQMPTMDWSGNGNAGALAGTGRLSSDCLPRVKGRTA